MTILNTDFLLLVPLRDLSPVSVEAVIVIRFFAAIASVTVLFILLTV